MAQTKFTEKDWNDIRAEFATSIMVDTSLSSLAQNLDGPDWPIKGKDETPSKYIDLTYAEAQDLLALKGQAPDKLDFLISILKETLSFDNPFGEMVEQTAIAAERDNPFLKNLARLGISETYPVTLTGLTPDTLEFCKLENLATLGAFAVFAQGMSQNVIVGGDFRKLLNALANVDEAVLAELLPFRRGAKGLHLVEALAQVSQGADSDAKVNEVFDLFPAELEAIGKDITAGGTLARNVATLGNPESEKRVADLIEPRLKGREAPSEPKAKRGLFGKLASLFGK
jgi:hypothetical protein